MFSHSSYEVLEPEEPSVFGRKIRRMTASARRCVSAGIGCLTGQLRDGLEL